MDTGARATREIARLGAPIVLAILFSSSCARAQEPQTAIVLANTGVVRLAPSLEAEAVLAAPRGTEFTVSASTEGWVKVALATGGEGWIPEAELGLKVRRAGDVCVEMGLKEAIDLGAIDGGFRGTGSSTGDAVVLRGSGTLTVAICPEFRPGSVLRNANASGQDMVAIKLRGASSGLYISPVAELRFEPAVEAEYVFEAYCLNFFKENPAESDRMTLAEPAPESVLSIIEVGGPDIEATQLAIWAVTDDITRTDAQTHFAATDEQIAAARSLITSAGLSAASYRLFSSGGPD